MAAAARATILASGNIALRLASLRKAGLNSDLPHDGLHTSNLVPIGTEIRFEKYQYFTVSLRIGS